MSEYSLSHLRDRELLSNLNSSSKDETAATAYFLANIAEVDKRRLYVPEGYPSMHSYCVHELGRSPKSAYKRIRAARVALRFPRIFRAVADGRLFVSGVVLLAPHLNPENADELLDKAEGRSEGEIEQLIAEYFPRPDVPELMRPLPPLPAEQLSARTVEDGDGVLKLNARAENGQAREAPPVLAKVTPLSAEGFELKTTIDRRTHEKLLYAQALIGSRVPRRAIARVFELALDALIARLEKQKFGVTSRPQPSKPRSSDNPRYIPLAIRRDVWERDGGQCTYVSETGQRCPECARLEFDHALEVARGGQSTVENIRLRCRAHNQHTAEQTFGKTFMDRKRREAMAARQQAEAARAQQQRVRARAEEVIPWLRQLGVRPADAHRAAALCERIPEASIEDRVRLALSACAPRAVVRRPVAIPAM